MTTIKKDAVYFLTMTVVDWIDVFSRQNHRDAIIDSLNYCIEYKGLKLHAYCIMTNHVHMVASAGDPENFSLDAIMRDFKKFTAKKIIAQIKKEPESRRKWLLALFKENTVDSKKHKTYKFWKRGNFAIEVHSNRMLRIKINYIHQNPVKANFVKYAEDWEYSSARVYAGFEEAPLLKIHPVDFKSTGNALT